MAAKKGSLRIWDFVVIFALVFLGSRFIMPYIFPDESANEGLDPVVLTMEDPSLRLGAVPVAVIQNNTNAPLTIPDRCPRPVFDIYSVGSGNTLADITTDDETTLPCEKIEPIEAGDSVSVNLGPWKQALFSTTGIYEIELPLELSGTGAAQNGTGAAAVSGSEQSQYREGIIARFEITEPGVPTKLFRAFITKPLLNAIIFIASMTPGYNLGVAIILLTLAVKLLLFIPTQHALEGQKKMQLLQPKLEEVRRTYGSDPQKMQAETMKLWKENKVNPFQSCLPLLVQFPILIGLFYVIREGVHLELSQHLVYPFYQDIDWTFGTQFLGFDLTQSYPWIFPPLLVILQFLQMKLTFHISDKKKARELEKTTTKIVDTPQELQQKIMIYALPLMIGFFAIKYPSALSLYWAVSTLFAIGQQLIVNREHIRA
jgi:YidC/Oxa1 family membrane protein insertase